MSKRRSNLSKIRRRIVRRALRYVWYRKWYPYGLVPERSLLVEIIEGKVPVAAFTKPSEEIPEVVAYERLAKALVELSVLKTKPEVAKPKATKLPARRDKAEVNSSDLIKEFYQSAQWRRVRYWTIKRQGAKCQCCGRSPAIHGIVLNVDHIKNLRDHWELRLDPNNLQVLCDACNHGKGNWDETDWRS